ncbi:IS66 family insertion sequence element accessory protein TnpA [Photorhabdus hindustanensis]|uniref:IS66 family insertion sequence element accessory protein TnpA n=1 Tax=Photorhabdus hindustanensis TaxID=2918802 RepID=UPI001C61376A|nr:hypothetical protein [Photorhabdus hindustanensis]
MSRSRYTPEQKQHHVTQWRHSGLTRKQYCEQHQLSFVNVRSSHFVLPLRSMHATASLSSLGD